MSIAYTSAEWVAFPKFAVSPMQKKAKGKPAYNNINNMDVLYNATIINKIIENVQKASFSSELISLGVYSMADNPFDAINFTILSPDIVCRNDIENILKLASVIIDKSEEISFNDGWDD
jgi:hypothetical protein